MEKCGPSARFHPVSADESVRIRSWTRKCECARRTCEGHGRKLLLLNKAAYVTETKSSREGGGAQLGTFVFGGMLLLVPSEEGMGRVYMTGSNF